MLGPVVSASEQSVFGEVNHALATRSFGEREFLLFFHRFNTTTSDAILRLAQFGEDADFKGFSFLVTWASAALTPRSQPRIDCTGQDQGHVRFQTQAQGEAVNVCGYSMGAELTMGGPVDVQQAGRRETRGRIVHVMVASMDIDLDLFQTQIAHLPHRFLDYIYSLASKHDAALQVLWWLVRGIPRVGAAA